MNNRLRNRVFGLLAAVLFLLGWEAPSKAGATEQFASAWVRGDYGQVRLVSATDRFGADGTVLVGIQMRLFKGWKTYWRTPGESGIPADFDWSASSNIHEVDLQWPTPQRFTEFGSQSFGYKQEVIFPVTVSAEEPGQPLRLDVVMGYGVCRDICIPVESHLSLIIPPSQGGEAGARTHHARHIDRFIRRVPAANGAGGFWVSRLALDKQDSALLAQIDLEGGGKLQSLDIVLELGTQYTQDQPRVTISENGSHAAVLIPLKKDPDAPSLRGHVLSVVAWDEAGHSVQADLPIE